jgi:hypothetical protein
MHCFSVFKFPSCGWTRYHHFQTANIKFFLFIQIRFMVINLWIIRNCPTLKVKLSRYKPGGALGVPRDWGVRISRQSAHEGGNSPTLPYAYITRRAETRNSRFSAVQMPLTSPHILRVKAVIYKSSPSSSLKLCSTCHVSSYILPYKECL